MSDAKFTTLLGRPHQSDPYPDYIRLRGEAPVHRFTDIQGVEWWAISRYEDVWAALADRRFSNDMGGLLEGMRKAGLPPLQREDGVGYNMATSDPPDHTRLRRLVGKSFTPRRIEGLRPRVQEIADELLDLLPASGEVDLIDAFAFPLPVTVICELLGVPVEDRDDFRIWSGARTVPPMSTVEGGRAMRAYLRDLVERRRPEVRTDLTEEEQPDLLSSLIVASDEEAGRLSHPELLGMLTMLLDAGQSTTLNLIGNGILALLQNPDQLQLLRARPDLIPSAVEELLRYDSPVQRSTLRSAAEDVEVGGVTIPKGSLVSIGIGSANRDDHQFDQPDRLDVTRTDNRHVAFGRGIHFCLGAPLARQEGQIAFATLLRRFPDIALGCSPDELRWRRRVSSRACAASSPCPYGPLHAAPDRVVLDRDR